MSAAPQGTWVPESERTPTWIIFHQVWKCRAPVFQMRSLEDVEHFGVPTSGERDFDAGMMSERRLQYMTIAQMVELFQRDVTVGLFDVNDAKQIYEVITDHLKLWQDTLAYSPNVKPAPEVFEELMLMDGFAQAVWPHAQPLFTTEFVESVLLRRITSIMLPEAADNKEAPPPVTKDNPYVLPERDSFAEIFANRRALNRSWNGE
ncbi:MAG: hypothetical protein P4L77_10805 [Sulfuriferula sp.]|nr:hypothetical protein [Sulfuriferula sp.]